MQLATQRVVVQTSGVDKRAFTAKAKKLGIPLSELMRRGAHAYSDGPVDEELGQLADTARAAAERSCDAIDQAVAFVQESQLQIDASNARIEAMAKAARWV